MIELATPDDLEGVCDLLLTMYRERRVTVNEAKARGVISQSIQDGGCLISRQQGVTVGTVSIIKRQIDELTDDAALFSRWFYVHPKHRTEGHAVRLIAALKQASRNTGLPLFIRVETSLDELSRLKFFKKHMNPCAGVFSFVPSAEEMAA